jgi:hypothetical protein
MKTQADTITGTSQYMRGFADAKLREAENLDTICCSIFPNYNIDRYEAIAVRVYLGKESILTVYARDKESRKSTSSEEKFPVKKFKANMPVEEIINHFLNINLTIIKEDYDLNDIEVINK